MLWSKNSNNWFHSFCNFFSKSYSFDDLKNKKNMFSFVFSVMKHAKAVNITDVHDQLIWIYNTIASELTKNINSSKKIIFVLIFFKQLDNKREIWFCIYFRKFNKDSFKFEYQSFFKYQNFNFYFKYDRKDNKKIYKLNQKQSQIVERQKKLLLVSLNEKFNKNNQIQIQNLNRINENKKNAFSFEQKQNIQNVDSFWYRQFLKNYNFKKKNYRNEYILNNYDRRKRENYRFDRWQNNQYEDRKQYQKTYADEKRFYKKKSSKSYENINFNEKFDDEEFVEFYFYNLHSKSLNVCKKYDKLKKDFFLIMFFIIIFVAVQKKNR